MDRRSLCVALAALLLSMAALAVSLLREPQIIIERHLETPGPERVVTVEIPAPQPEKPSRALTAREISDVTSRRVAKSAEIAEAKRRLAALVTLLSTDGHQFPDNSVIKAHAWSKKGGGWHPGRFTYEEWARHKDQRMGRHNPIPESMRYRGEELSPGNWNQYDFERIEQHARYLYDPDKHADLRVKSWPGARYKSWSFKPDTYEKQVIAAHHAIWNAEIEMEQIEAELGRLGK